MMDKPGRDRRKKRLSDRRRDTDKWVRKQVRKDYGPKVEKPNATNDNSSRNND